MYTIVIEIFSTQKNPYLIRDSQCTMNEIVKQVWKNADVVEVESILMKLDSFIFENRKADIWGMTSGVRKGEMLVMSAQNTKPLSSSWDSSKEEFKREETGNSFRVVVEVRKEK